MRNSLFYWNELCSDALSLNPSLSIPHGLYLQVHEHFVHYFYLVFVEFTAYVWFGLVVITRKIHIFFILIVVVFAVCIHK